MNDNYPKVTIVSANPLRDDRCSGILMRSLFATWPQDRLSQVYFRVAVPHLPNVEDCGEYRVIGMTGAARRVFPVAPDQFPCGGDSTASAPPGGLRQRFVREAKRRVSVLRSLRSAREIWAAQPWCRRALQRQLEALQPDIVYAIFGNYWLTKTASTACRQLGIPLFVHVVDDFVSALYQDVPLASKLQAASDRWFRRAVGSADALAAISPVMADEYARRYGRPWSWFTTLINADAYDPAPRSADGTIRLVYAGSLDLARWESLRTIALALRELRDKEGIQSQLVVYAAPAQLGEHRHALDVPPVTDLRGWVAPDQLPEVFHDTDVLVHVESFQPALTGYTKLSFSTKLSQYMMAGRCILAFGPADLGSIRVVRDAGAALVIGENNFDAVVAGLRQLLTDANIRQRIAQQGREWALQNVECRKGQAVFHQQLIAALQRRQDPKRYSPAA